MGRSGLTLDDGTCATFWIVLGGRAGLAIVSDVELVMPRVSSEYRRGLTLDDGTGESLRSVLGGRATCCGSQKIVGFQPLTALGEETLRGLKTRAVSERGGGSP